MSKTAILVAILIVVALASSELIFDKTAAEDQTALPPIRTLGDKWTLSTNFSSGMTGTTTEEITNISVSVSSYDCTELTITGGGTYSGIGTGSWTMSGTQYETKTDYSSPKSVSALDTKTTAFNETIITAVENNPPVINIAFPIFVGKNWISTTTQLFNTQHILNGALTQGNSSQPTSLSFSVLRSEEVTVPAGKFQTFVIKRVQIDNTPNNGTNTIIYYSAKAHMQIKELDYLPNGILFASSELLNYSVTEPTSSPTPTATSTTNPTTNPTQQPTSTLKPTVTSPSPTSSLSGNVSATPTVPELSWLMIVPLLLSMFSVAVIVNYRKTVKPS